MQETFSLSNDAATVAYTTGQYPNGTAVDSMFLYSALPDGLFAMDYVHQSELRQADVFVTSSATPVDDALTSASYNRTQCRVTFTPHIIQVHVNTTARIITTHKLSEVVWPGYADALTGQALVALRALTVKDNGVGESQVWRAMQSNTETLYYSKYGMYPTTVDDSLLFESIADFISNVLDSSILMAGACQKEFYEATQVVPSSASIWTVVFGHSEFQYIIFVITILVVLICAGYIIFRNTGNAVQLDLADFANVALNSSRGGTELFDKYRQQNRSDSICVTLRDPSHAWPGIEYAAKLEKENRHASKFERAPSDTAKQSARLIESERYGHGD